MLYRGNNIIACQSRSDHKVGKYINERVVLYEHKLLNAASLFLTQLLRLPWWSRHAIPGSLTYPTQRAQFEHRDGRPLAAVTSDAARDSKILTYSSVEKSSRECQVMVWRCWTTC